jgi:hypothetical protein
MGAGACQSEAVGRASSKSGRPKGRAAQWESLRSGLAAALSCLEREQFVILKTRGPTGLYVQLVHGGPTGMLVEALSNRFLTDRKRLDQIAESRLRWQR